MKSSMVLFNGTYISVFVCVCANDLFLEEVRSVEENGTNARPEKCAIKQVKQTEQVRWSFSSLLSCSCSFVTGPSTTSHCLTHSVILSVWIAFLQTSFGLCCKINSRRDPLHSTTTLQVCFYSLPGAFFFFS